MFMFNKYSIVYKMDDLGQNVNDARSEDVASADDLDVFSDEYNLDEIDVYIQANLEDEIVRDALEKGIDLRHYSKQVEAELIKVENASIGDYIRETQNLATLHKQISSCDEILEVMEQMLKGFQMDLTSISSEIKTLQDQSVKMNIKLKNRQAVKGELSQFVDEMVVSEDMIRVIMDSNVTEREFLEQLYELNHKINFVKQQTFNNAKSCLDVKDILDKLKFKSLEKIREFFLLKIQQFRKPMTNYQIPQNAMLKYRFFNEFLMSHERNVAKEIRDKYIDTMNKIYYSYFKAYSSRIMKLQYDEVADKDDLMGVEDTAKKGFFANKPSLKNKSTIFSLGSRGNVLTTDLEGPPIVAHSTQKFPYESLFRSLQYALLDNCCREHLFLQDFYMASGVASLELFNLVFSKTLGLSVKQVDAYVSDCFDAIALFLCMNIVEKFKVIMQKRGTSVLDRYWESLFCIIEPRFLHLLQLNIQSIRECDPQKLGQFDVRPHYMTRRYAEFTAAIVGLNEGSSNERILVLLSQLQAEMDNFLTKLALAFVNRKDRLVFLVNNYDIIINVIIERTTENTRECEFFKELMVTRTHEYIEEILNPHFEGIMTFVKDCEAREGIDSNPANERRVIHLVRGFNNDWKKAIELINQEIMRSFSNFKNGTQILQGSLTQLIQYYHRFHKVLSQKPFASYPIRSELINIHNVMVEVKKHKLNF